MSELSTPGQWLAKLASDELAQLVRELVKARKGKDSGVHKARKALQRLRGLLRLARTTAPEWHARVDGQLRHVRRRLGRLRDAAVRAELVGSMRDNGLPAEQQAPVDTAVAALVEAHRACWTGLDPAFWDRIDRSVARHLAAFDRWPLPEVSESAIHEALEKERRKAGLAAAKALGHVQRNRRHEMRRLLRRYAAMRKAAAYVLRQRDPGCKALVEAARELGVEGDLWLTATALRVSAGKEQTRALRSALEKHRRALCKKHDGELASLRRGLLSRRQAGHAARAKSARKAEKAARAAAGGADK
ncbi:CHAD domain-containing protein [Pseudomarimonas salicorniae]|uniref:CHAD domain-containing protein n=1 Tax=Pseudomarimonas salicorniae TaxID=2933270 RepID=A0ABT0GHN0_9GAMM|nr:CHAD domain-containing protein [Lysobacter sp. CAU 1642]MCK7594040.1 CHAD domain-containing protein [Lysobacter sp. CAU 1642]